MKRPKDLTSEKLFLYPLELGTAGKQADESNDPYGYLNKNFYVRACSFIHAPNHGQDQALDLLLKLKRQMDVETPFTASSDLWKNSTCKRKTQSCNRRTQSGILSLHHTSSPQPEVREKM